MNEQNFVGDTQDSTEDIQYQAYVALVEDFKELIDTTLTPPTIKIVGFLGGSGMAHHHTTTRQRVTRFPTKSYGCSFP